jgi:hypothetical protein
VRVYNQGFKNGCTDQKAGILTYDSQGRLDESVYDKYGSSQYILQPKLGCSDGIDACK